MAGWMDECSHVFHPFLKGLTSTFNAYFSALTDDQVFKSPRFRLAYYSTVKSKAPFVLS